MAFSQICLHLIVILLSPFLQGGDDLLAAVELLLQLHHLRMQSDLPLLLLLHPLPQSDHILRVCRQFRFSLGFPLRQCLDGCLGVGQQVGVVFGVLGDLVITVNDPAHVFDLLLLGVCSYGLNSESVFAVDGFLEVVDLVAHGQLGLQLHHPFPESFLELHPALLDLAAQVVTVPLQGDDLLAHGEIFLLEFDDVPLLLLLLAQRVVLLLHFQQFRLFFCNSLAESGEFGVLVVLVADERDVLDHFVPSQFLDAFEHPSVLQFCRLQLLLLLLDGLPQTGLLTHQAEPLLLPLLSHHPVPLLLLVKLDEQLVDLMGESFNQHGPFLLLACRFLDLLLIGGLVVVEAVLDGEDVLVDGYSVSEKLHQGGSTFSSWSICPCFSMSFSCSSFSSISRYLISSCSPRMYCSSTASALGLFFSRSILAVKAEEEAVLSNPSTLRCTGEVICLMEREWARLRVAADLLFFMGGGSSAISIMDYRELKQVDQQSSIWKLPFLRQHRFMSLRRFIHSRNCSWSLGVRQWILVTVLPKGDGEGEESLADEEVMVSLLPPSHSLSPESLSELSLFRSNSASSLKSTIGYSTTSSRQPLEFICSSQQRSRQSSTNAISCLDLLNRRCLSRSRVYLFLSAFSVRPWKQQTISDHFLLPLLFLISVSNCMSSDAIQGPFLSLGFRKQFQCYRHCLELRKTLWGEGLRWQSSSATAFQLRWVKCQTAPCWASMMALRRSLSSVLQLQLERLVFRMLSHLNMQLPPVTPGITCATRSQSSTPSSFSMLPMPCWSQYLLTTQTRMRTSSSLQFFLSLLFLTIFSMRHEASRRTVSSLMQHPTTFLFRFTCSQCAITSSRMSLFRCYPNSPMKAARRSLAASSSVFLERDQGVLGWGCEYLSGISCTDCSQLFSSFSIGAI